MSWRPISNGEFYTYWSANRATVPLPPSWVEPAKDDASTSNTADPYGGMRVRTLYGSVPMKYAHRWPVMASYDMLSTYAVVRGGRLPTEAELRLFLDKFESGYEGGANVGFRNWHPTPPRVVKGKAEGGEVRLTNGGVWEWTSTVFDKVEGFKASVLYPGYSQDFFDGRHNVVVCAVLSLFANALSDRSFSSAARMRPFRVLQAVARCATGTSATTLTHGSAPASCMTLERTRRIAKCTSTCTTPSRNLGLARYDYCYQNDGY